MRPYLKIVGVITVLFACLTVQAQSAKTPKTVASKSKSTVAKASKKVTCMFCNGTGKGTGIPLTCMDCVSWSEEYKRKVACHKCKDKRVVYSKKCHMCEGTGKLDKEWYKFQ